MTEIVIERAIAASSRSGGTHRDAAVAAYGVLAPRMRELEQQRDEARAEVERLTAEGVAASERRDYYKARCAQMEADHAETVAEVEQLREKNAEIDEEIRFADAIERLGEVFGWTTMGDLIQLLETVEVDGTIHVTDNEAGACLDDCTGCLSERIAVAVARAVVGGEQP